MSDNTQKILFSALLKLLRPLARLLLRNGVPFSVFKDVAKKAYVDVAESEFELPGKKQTISRVATLTGLTRKEIKKIMTISEQTDQDAVARYNRAARVVYGWVHDPLYNRDGVQIDLRFEDGQEVSFSQLVKTYSGDVPPRAILDELLQVGVVEWRQDQIHLLAPAYIPTKGKQESYRLLGRDVAGLIRTMDKNIHLDEKPFFQRKVFYDNLTTEAVLELQNILQERGQEFLAFFDRWMAQRDRDVNPKVEGKGRNAVGIGLYLFEEDVDPENTE